MINKKWQDRFMRLAANVSTWSKDPSTQVGAVIVRPDRSVAAVGYNGFPRGVKDAPDRLEDRALKYPMTVHAEKNAILSAHERLDGYSIFVHPLCPCAPCAGAIIQAGIHTVYYPKPSTDTIEARERWLMSNQLATNMFQEAGVAFHEVDVI